MHQDILNADKEGELMSLFVKPTEPRMVQSINFYDEQVRDAVVLGRYVIMLSSSIPADSQLLCLFPNCRGGTVVRSQGLFQTLDRFNKAINTCMKDSLDHTDAHGNLKLVVAYGNHFFRCETISGNVYIFWAAYINKINVGNVKNCVFRNVPIIFNTDGAGRIVGVFILKTHIRDASDLARVPITAKSPRIMFERGMPLFVYDKREGTSNGSSPSKALQFLNQDEALRVVTSETSGFSKVVDEERNNFASSIDLEEMDVASLTDDIEQQPTTPVYLEPDPFDE
jgi:hypothetical protein